MKRIAIAALAALACFTAPARAQGAPESGENRAMARELYARIVGMDTSVEGKQTLAMAEYLAAQLRAGGLDASDVHVLPMGETAALVARYRGDGTGGAPILFLAHMDVVSAHRSDWQRDPFTLVEENGYFYGRGALDNKAGAALLAASFLRLKKEGFTPTRDLILAFTGDEETTGASARALVNEHRDLVDAEFALNSDAGGGRLSEDSGAAVSYGLQTAEKSFASYTLTARNAGGHSSLPRADNAIYDIADAINRIRAYAFPVMWNDTTIAYFRAAGPQTEGAIGAAMRRFAERPGDRRAAATLSASPSYVGQVRTTCVPTMISGGHADNALPQSVVATVNCRIFPGVTIEEVQAKLAELAGADIAVAPLDQYYSSAASPLREDVMAATTAAVHARHAGVPIIPSMSAGATDGVFFRAAGIPTYGVAEAFIKDSDDYAHGLNERNPVESFYGGLVYWDTMIRALAGKH